MNGKRVKSSKSLARTFTTIKVTCRVSALPKCPQGVPGGVYYPRKFKRGAHPERPQRVPCGVHYPLKFRRDTDTHGEEREFERQRLRPIARIMISPVQGPGNHSIAHLRDYETFRSHANGHISHRASIAATRGNNGQPCSENIS